MSGKCGHPGNASVRLMGAVMPVALLCMAISAPVLSQVHDAAEGQALTASAEDYQRYEAERLRQERVRLERERREQRQLQFEIERLRQENERQKQEQLRLENKQLRLENERREQEVLRLEIEARERNRAQAATLREQTEATDQSIGTDIVEQLRTIGKMRDDGILTEQEFQRLKKKILE
ncbi:MAG: SHOCT domain-containing protein [Woeseia sp.]